MSRIRRLRWVRIIAGIGLGAAACGAPDPAAEPPPAPGFVLEDLSGRPVSLADYAGRVVLVDFWATWCAPCVQQIPVLNAFQARYPDRVQVLGVSVDAEGREVVAPFAEEHAIEYPVLLGDEALARRYGAPGFPALAVVTPEGRLQGLHVGLVAPADLEAALAEVGD